MTTHETLKEICDMIWYESEYWFDYSIWFFYTDEYNWRNIKINEREIIYDPVFMEKLFEKVDETWVKIEILDHLHDPTSYLANLLWIWQKN